MTDEKNTSMDQIEFMKRMKAIASDLWGGVMPSYPAEEAPAAEKKEEPAPQETTVKKPGMDAIWKTADETVDWTDALAHSTPTDGLTAPRIWAFYGLHGNNSYLVLLRQSNNFLAVNQKRMSGLYSQCLCSHRSHVFNSRDTNRRNIKSQVLLRLGNLHHDSSAA